MATATAMPQQPLTDPTTTTAQIEITAKATIAIPNGLGLNASAAPLDLGSVKAALVDVIKAGAEDEAPTEEFVEGADADRARTYGLHEVAAHKASDDLWIVIDGTVYDVTRFQHEHPGGHKVMAGVAGKDATKKFDKYHRRGILERYNKDLKIGTIDLDAQPSSTSKKGLLGKLGVRKR